MKEIITEAIPVFAAFAAFAICYLANIYLGVSVNCRNNGEKWDWARLFKSLGKILDAIIINAGLVLAAYVAKQYVPDIPSVLTDFITTATFALLYFKGYKEALVGIYDKVRSMFEIKDSTDFDVSIIENMKIQRPANEFNVDTVNHEKTDTAIGVG